VQRPATVAPRWRTSEPGRTWPDGRRRGANRHHTADADSAAAAVTVAVAVAVAVTVTVAVSRLGGRGLAGARRVGRRTQAARRLVLAALPGELVARPARLSASLRS
jgi:hypothetical protein